MFSRLGTLMILGTIAAACAHAPTQTAEAPKPEAKRWVASADSNLFSDKYGDVQVAFCSSTNGVVVIDPNRCGEATAQGRGCTEMPVSFNPVTISKDPAGNSILKGERATYQLQPRGPTSFALIGADWKNPKASVNLGYYSKPDKEQVLADYCNGN